MVDPPTSLTRNVGLAAATGSGVAIIVGAGVYILLGEAAAEAGNAIWLSFILAGAAAFFTALSYAELASRLPKAAAAYNYTKEAFGDGPAFIVGWLSLVSQVVAISAVALGFGSYLSEQAGFPMVAGGLLLVVAACMVALRGVRESTGIGSLLALVETGGLVAVIAGGLSYVGSVDYLEHPQGVAGIMRGTSLLFFAFLGFEQVANLAQEIKSPQRNLPLAIMLSGGIAAALYILVAISSVSILGWQALEASGAPLADVAGEALGVLGADVLAMVALAATGSTVLIGLVAAARTAYGMAAGGSLPSLLSRVHAARRTPWVATVVIAIVAGAGVLSGDIGFAASVTNFTILLAFTAVNLSAIVLRRRGPRVQGIFRVPGQAFGVPVAPALGALTCAALLGSAGLWPAVAGSGIVVVAGAVHLARVRLKRRGQRRSA